MPLHLISGLPNTGRTEKLREEFEEAARAGRNPILLVPSVDDVFAWERRLTRAGQSGANDPAEPASALEAPAGGFAGGVVMHFNDLCREIVRRADGAGPRIAGEMRRRLALERAVAKVADEPDGPAAKIEGRTTSQPGLLDAALELVDEYRAERIEMGDPFRSTGEPIGDEGVEAGTIEAIRRGIEPLVTAFELDLADEGLTDLPKTAERALEAVVGLFRKEADWRERPFFVAGFDDMTGQQLELLRKLSNEAGVEVRMAVTWATDPGRGFLTDRLRSRLTDRVGITSEDRIRSDGDGDPPALALAGLADALIGAGERPELDRNPPVTLIRAAGERREAEAIAAEIARLLADRDREVLPDQIAVAHVDPGSSGRLLEGILRRYGIPATLETETGALETTVGASLAALLRAAGPDGTAGDLILWLRGPLGPERAEVDRIEARCRREGVGTAAEALDRVDEKDRRGWGPLFEEGGDRGSAALELTATLAREAGRRILEGSTRGPEGLRRPKPELELEVRMAETLAEAATDLAVSDTGGRSGAALMLEAIRRGDVSVWTVPTQGTVRITGLWAMRAKRVRFLFVAGLQEGGTRDLSRAGPFLSTAERRGLEMLERVDPEVQARYLLFSCLNVPTEELWLSCTISDDGGKSTAPSPLLAEIEALCPEPLPLIERNGSAVSFPVDRAPTAAELARSLAVVSGSVEDLDLDAAVAEEVRSSLERARDLAERSRTFGRFEDPEVLADLAGAESFSPSEIEAWLACPWTWFIDRRIRPGRFTPDEEFLAAGSLVHEVLETLYGRHQGERPESGTVADWIAELPELFDSILADDEGNPLAGDDPSARLARLSLERGVAGLLVNEADKASPSFVPALLESPLEEVEMGDWKLRGKVDRVDTEDGRKPGDGVRALVIDYKSGRVGSRYAPDAMVEKGTVQIPLYMEALRRSLGIEPVAGFVLPVRDGDDRRPRGAIPAGEPEVIGERGTYRKGTVPDIDEFITRALDLSSEAIDGIRGGEIEHSEGGCRNHYDDSGPLLPPLRPAARPDVRTELVSGQEAGERDGEDEDGGGDFDFSEQQERVIRSDADEIMVSAAAGSGKTTVTVERYKRLLDGQGLSPDQILVFTFTDQAAAKLREEVRRARSAATGEPVTMSDAWVGTFHSICSRILTAYPLEAGVDPGFTVIDDINSSIMRRKAFDRALRRRLEATEEEGTEEAERRMAALAQVSRHTLRDTIDSIFDLLRSRGDEFPRLVIPFDRPDYPEAEIVALAGAIEDALALEGVKRFSDEQKGKCRKMLALIEDREIRMPTASDFDDLSFSNQDLEEQTGLIGSWQAITKTLAEREAWPWLIEFGALLEEFGREYARLKDERSALDFEDLQIKALGLLEGNDAISAEYGSRFVEIMVDEFQDTNQLQMKLIEALRGRGVNGGGRARLLTVGDEMQAIYGFRHADVEIFRERRRELAGGGDRVDLIDLPENHRSTPAVIEAVNALGREIHSRPGEGDEAGPPPFTELQAGRDDTVDGPATTLILTPKDGWEESNLGDLAPAESDLSKDKKATVAEALALASTIRDLIDEGKYSQGDVAVLLRKTTDLPTFEAALNQFGLRTVVPASKGFWKSRPVGELIALLSTVANPHDDEAVISVLTSPACGSGPDGLWKVREAAGRGQPLWKGVAELARENEGGGTDGDLAAIASLYRVVEEARNEAATLPLESLVSGLLDRSGLDLANLFRDRSSLAYLERIATIAGNYERQEGRDLRGFLDWAAASREADAEAAIATASEDEDAVKIMTIHKSKGLEFPVVCVADLGRGLGAKYDGPVRIGFEGTDGAMEVGFKVPGAGTEIFHWETIQDRVRTETEAEELRLLHVAMTRAEERLILSGKVHPPSRDTPTQHRSAMLRICDRFGLSPSKPEEWVSSFESSGLTEAFALKANLPGDDGTAPEELLGESELVVRTRRPEGTTPPLTRPTRAFFPDVPLSFSGLSEFRECPTRFFARRVLRMEVEGRSGQWAGPEKTGLTERDGGTRFGTAVHELLEESAAAGWKSPDAARAEAALEAERVGKEGDGTPEKAVEMITAFLESDLGTEVQGDSVATTAELPIVLGIGGLTIRGFVDLLVERDGELTVVDYKTNQLKGRDPEELMEGYELQRDLYALAVARARGLDSIGTSFVFLEAADRPVEKTYDRAALDEVERRLTVEVVEPITNARYFGGEGEGPEPCGGCEACRLFGLGPD